MSASLIFIVTAIYAVVAGLQAIKADYANALFLGGCAVANVGIMLRVGN